MRLNILGWRMLRLFSFFQFDQEGNMYVFEPGAGCSGDARLVKPGDEYIFG